MGITLVDAGTGYVVGTLAAVGVAIAMAMLPALEHAVMPTAIVLQLIPIVAMAPLIALVFGRGLIGVTIVVGLVTFFPTLVLVIAGLRSAPAQACDVILSCGGSRLTAMRKVQTALRPSSAFCCGAHCGAGGDRRGHACGMAGDRIRRRQPARALLCGVGLLAGQDKAALLGLCQSGLAVPVIHLMALALGH